MNKTLIIILLIAILGIFFLGKGITGLVVSQSCCFPPDCDAENLCDAATETFLTPWGSYFFTIFGMTLIVIAVVSLIRMHPPDV